MSPPTVGETRDREAMLAAQRKQADALERIATVLEKGVALGERVVVALEALAGRGASTSKPPRSKRTPLEYFHEQLGAIDTGDKAVELWLPARAALQETDKSAEGLAMLAKRLVAARRITSPDLATEWLKAQVAQADGRRNAPAPDGGSR